MLEKTDGKTVKARELICAMIRRSIPAAAISTRPGDSADGRLPDSSPGRHGCRALRGCGRGARLREHADSAPPRHRDCKLRPYRWFRAVARAPSSAAIRGRLSEALRTD